MKDEVLGSGKDPRNRDVPVPCGRSHEKEGIRCHQNRGCVRQGQMGFPGPAAQTGYVPFTHDKKQRLSREFGPSSFCLGAEAMAKFCRKIIKRYEIQQRARYMCTFCGKDRIAVAVNRHPGCVEDVGEPTLRGAKRLKVPYIPTFRAMDVCVRWLSSGISTAGYKRYNHLGYWVLFCPVGMSQN